MNARQHELYTNLMNLVESDEAFYCADQVLNEGTAFSGNFRIFNYLLASYTQWLNPDALECRGVMFLMNSDFTEPLALVSWPFEKFFNLHENPMTMNLDMSSAVKIQNKMDGSLISTYYFDGHVRVKSKGSLHSDQAQAAQTLLESKEYAALYNALEYHVMVMDHTVIMEYTAPDNRIVIPSEKPTLTVLGVRDNQTGEYVDDHQIIILGLAPYMVGEVEVDVSNGDEMIEFVESIPAMTGIEGFVITMASGQRVKIKTDWYSTLHHLKDSIHSERRLFEAIVYDTVDDVRAQFWDDEDAMARIDAMSEKVQAIYNHMVTTVEEFYQAHKHLEQKEFAILAQKEIEPLHFHLTMALYNGHDVDFRKVMVKNRKQFGIKDDPKQLEE